LRRAERLALRRTKGLASIGVCRFAFIGIETRRSLPRGLAAPAFPIVAGAGRFAPLGPVRVAPLIAAVAVSRTRPELVAVWPSLVGSPIVEGPIEVRALTVAALVM
jgi:hypothetical protein